MGIVRKTKPVIALLKVFDNTDEALSVVKLVQDMKRIMNKTTVYRILERLEEGGMLHSFMDSNGLKWYAKRRECSDGQHTDAHPHFQCKFCGKMECLEQQVKIPNLPNHTIDTAELLLVGTCADCHPSK